jgi:hypothetical protein
VLAPLSIGLCQSEKDFKRELKRLKIPLSECSPWIPNGHDGKMWEFNKVKGCHDRCCIVCIRAKKKNSPGEIVGLIVHESIHVWQAIKELIGERYPSPEFEAYSIQSIAQRLILVYKKDKK